MAGRQWQASMRRALMHILIRGQGCLKVEVPTPTWRRMREGREGSDQDTQELCCEVCCLCVLVRGSEDHGG